MSVLKCALILKLIYLFMRQLVRPSRDPYRVSAISEIRIYTIVDNDLSPMHFRLATWIGDPPACAREPAPASPASSLRYSQAPRAN